MLINSHLKDSMKIINVWFRFKLRVRPEHQVRFKLVINISSHLVGPCSCLAGHQKVMRFPGKRHLPLVIRYFCPRPAFKKVWPYITVWKSWLQFDCRFVSTFAGMQMLHSATQVQRIKLHIERWSKNRFCYFWVLFSQNLCI